MAFWKSDRVQHEDAVKHLLHCKQRNQAATIESLAGAVGMSRRRTLKLLARMEAGGLLRARGDALELTGEGERLALQIVRAHRLWETYLAQEAAMPLSRVHEAAEHAEHNLTTAQLDALDAHLGYPHTDPHGDPIPAATGALAELAATALTDWPVGQVGRIVHIEDEPAAAFSQIHAMGLRPGRTVRILERNAQRLLLTDGEQEFHLAPIIAASIQLRAIPAAPTPTAEAKRLADWPMDKPAEIVRLDALLRGINRRRLLDLGVTPGTRIVPVLRGTFGSTRAYRVRGTMIALRTEQAGEVWVKEIANDAQVA